MRPLNSSAITTAYFHFLCCFLVLMGSVLLIFYAFLTTLTQQAQQLRSCRTQYDRVLSTQRALEQKTDSLYVDFSLLNTGLVNSDRLVEQRILRKKDELAILLQRTYFGNRPHAVYTRVPACVKELLVLKDSIHNAEGRIQDTRRELHNCQKSELLKRN